MAEHHQDTHAHMAPAQHGDGQVHVEHALDGGGHSELGHHDDPASIAQEVSRYKKVFFGLAFLTGVTVGAAVIGHQMHLSMIATIIVALFIACIKGFLVAAYFMHLLAERKLIYGVLILTVFFFGVLMWGPWHHVYEAVGHHHNNPPDTPAPHQPVVGH